MRNSVLIKKVGNDLEAVLSVEAGHGALGFKDNRVGIELAAAGLDCSRHNLRSVTFPANGREHAANTGDAGFIPKNSGIGKDGIAVFQKDMEAVAVNRIDILIMILLLHHENGAAGHENPMQLNS